MCLAVLQPAEKKEGEKLKMSFVSWKTRRDILIFETMKYVSSFQNNRRREKKRVSSQNSHIFVPFSLLAPKNRYILFVQLVWTLVCTIVWWWVPLSKTSHHLMLTPVQLFFALKIFLLARHSDSTSWREREIINVPLYDVCTTHTLFFFLLPCVGGACFVLHDRDRSSGLELACD
jgi:hypothetical protein